MEHLWKKTPPLPEGRLWRLWGTANSVGLTFRSLALEPAFPELGATTKLPEAPFPFTCPRGEKKGEERSGWKQNLQMQRACNTPAPS